MSPKTETNGYRPFSRVISSGDRANAGGISNTAADSVTVHKIHKIFIAAYRDLCSFAQNIVGSQEQAQDVVQQAFTNTLMAMGRGVEIHNISGYLNRSVRNLAIDQMRRTSDHESIDDKLEHLCDSSSPDSSELKAQYKEVATAVDDLVPSQRRAFLLAELKGLGYEEIANEMNRSTDSVRMLLCRARRRVRAAVGVNRELAGVLTPVLAAKARALSWTRAKATNLQEGFDNWINSSMNTVVQHSTTLVAGALIAVLPAGPLSSRSEQPASQSQGYVKTVRTTLGLDESSGNTSNTKKVALSGGDAVGANDAIRVDQTGLTGPSDEADNTGDTRPRQKHEIDTSAVAQSGSDGPGAGSENSDPDNGGGYNESEFLPIPPDPPAGGPPPEVETGVTPLQPGGSMGATRGAPIPSDPVNKAPDPGISEPNEPVADAGNDDEPDTENSGTADKLK